MADGGVGADCSSHRTSENKGDERLLGEFQPFGSHKIFLATKNIAAKFSISP